MKLLFSTMLLLVTLLATSSAQYFIIDTLKLNNAYKELLCSPQSLEKQKEYFNAFPCNWAEFHDTYKYCSNDGYDLSMYRRANEHIQALGNCTAINDTLFCNCVWCRCRGNTSNPGGWRSPSVARVAATAAAFAALVKQLRR